MAANYIVKLTDCTTHSPIGNKARSLLFLEKAKYKIPETYICTWDAYKCFLSHPAETKKAVCDSFLKIANKNKAYAVRSSSNLEDSQHNSYAGLFTTVLNVQGAHAFMDAIESIWATANSSAVSLYANKMNVLGKDDSLMAVIIQDMIPSEYSGVVFTQNPLTGEAETIIEAVSGSGDKLVQGGVTPSRWIINRGEYVEEPNNSTIPRKIIDQVLAKSMKISKLYGKPLDLEWAFSNGTIYWLQMREITSLQTIDIYTNQFSKEFLPGMIKPLVWSIKVPIINGAWIKMLTEIIGPNDLDVHRLAKAFYHRAYFNTGVIESIFEKIGFSNKTLNTLIISDNNISKKLIYRPGFKSLKFLPRISIFILNKIGFSKKADRFLKAVEKKIKDFSSADAGQLTDKQILNEIEKLLTLTRDISYYYLVSPFIVYGLTYLLRLFFAKKGLDVEALADSENTKELEPFDPNIHLEKLSRKFSELDCIQQQKIKNIPYNDFLKLEGIAGFKSEMLNFLKRFGHVSDSGNDFSYPPWRETPSLILKLVTNHEKRIVPPTHQDVDTLKDISFFKKKLLKIILKKLQRSRITKEKVSYLYTYTYGMLRDLFLAMGFLFKQKDFIETSEDIFFMNYDEIKETVRTGIFSALTNKEVFKRKQEISQYKNMELPNTIYGDQEPPVGLLRKGSFDGVATSRGYYCGRVKVIKGISEYNKIAQGDILVIPYSDIGLAPLFSKAGAIISESGGMLSHCSIIAREYKIPAVTSVEGACSLPDNTLVTVDGYKGEAIIHEQPDEIN